MDVPCPMCYLPIPPNTLNSHLGLTHQNDANFRVTCDFPGCDKSYDNWKSYRQHNWRNHNRNVRDYNMIENISSSSESGDDETSSDDIFEDVNVLDAILHDIDQPPPPNQQFQLPDDMTASQKLKYQTAHFVASLRENLLIPQTSMDTIIKGTCKLVEDYLQLTQDELLGDNMGDAVSADAVREAFNKCKPSNIFRQCSTPHHISTFMQQTLNRVAPEKVSIGKKTVWTKKGQLMDQEYFAYIPNFLQSLQLCLNNPDILACVDNPLPHEKGILRSVTDAYYYRSHPVFLNDPKALAFLIYYDDVEITNPLGSKSHKLAMFYWTLLNIYPEHRSTHRVHNLLGITTSENLKNFGVRPILTGFIESMKQLGEPDGVKLVVGNQERVFHGFLVFAAGDTPASSLLGGFKESVGGARKPCRRCLVSREEIKNIFDIAAFDLRTAASHNNHLRTILNEEMTPRAKIFWSKQYGVKSESCLLDIGNFDITKCLPHDFMHTVAEGVLASHLTVFIKHCVNEGKFTLDDLNTSSAKFNYSCFSKDKPSRIDQAHLQNGIKQNAAQMIVLGQTLPFVIGRWLDDSVTDHLSVFILLMQIVNICLAFVLAEHDADILSLMIQTHHLRFKALYGDGPITPKWHYFLHIPEQIVLFGPPRQHWCMRLEALHSYFKNVARRLKNFRNLSFSLANRKQNLQCVDFSFIPGTTRKPFLYHGDRVTSGTNKTLGTYEYSDLVRRVFPDIPENDEIVCAGSIEVLGSTYKKEFGILREITDNTLPEFGKIVEIVVWHEKVAIVYSLLETNNYSSKLNAYEVVSPERPVFHAVSINDLILKHSLPIFEYDSQEFVILTYYRRTEFLG